MSPENSPPNRRRFIKSAATTGAGLLFLRSGTLFGANRPGNKLNIALMDFWQWVGGTQQINSWYIPNYNASSDPQRYTFFYSDSRTKQLYKDWATFVLNRTNSITGVKYKDDPTIFAWDLMNEPEISSALEGITRDSVIRIAQDFGIPLVSKRITRDEVYVADEAFFTGTAAEVTPIRELNNRTIGSGKRGPVTERLQKAFFDCVTGKSDKYRDWLAPVAA
jgi:hypothetical protein